MNPKLKLCAGLVPQFNEPCCLCKMERECLPPSAERIAHNAYMNSPEGKAEQAAMMAQVASLFGGIE